MQVNNIVNEWDVETWLDNPLKVYPYKLVNLDGNRSFMENGAISIVYLSNQNFSNQLEFDEVNNAYYFNCLPQFKQQTQIKPKNVKVFAKQFESNLSIDILATNLPTFGKNELIETGNYEIYPMFYTIGKPLNVDEFVVDKQQIFIAESIDVIEDIDINDYDEFLLQELEVEALQEATLTNIKQLYENFTNAKIIPTTYPVIKDNTFDTIELTIPSTSFIGGSKSIFAKGKKGNEYIDVDFVSLTPLIPFKVSPITVDNNKLELFMDWFDYDTDAPLAIANAFLNGSILNAQIPNTTHPDGSSTKLLPDELDRQFIYDCIGISYGFASQWKDIPTITESNNINFGKVDPKYTIGFAKINVYQLIGQNAINVLDGLYQKWLRDNKIDENDPRAIIVKILINLLSKYIYGSHSVGKGDNAFNQVYLPWYLQANNSLNLTLNTNDSSNYIFNGDDTQQTFNIKSRYFDIVGNQFALPSKIDLSITKLVQTDRKLTLPAIDEVIQPITKLLLPGDISTTDNTALKDIVYIPSSNIDAFKKIFMETPKSTSDNTNIKYNSKQTNLGYSFTQDTTILTDWLKEQISSVKGVPESKITINDFGTDTRLTTSQTENYKVGDTQIPDYDYNDPYWVQIYKKYFKFDTDPTSSSYGWVPDFIHPEWDRNNNRLTLTDDDVKLFITISSKPPQDRGKWEEYDPVNISIINKNTYLNYFNRGIGKNFYNVNVNHTYDISAHYLKDVSVSIQGFIITIDYNREIIFTKDRWRSLTGKLNAFDTSEQIIGLQTNENILIDKITELYIKGYWMNDIRLKINNQIFDITLYQKDDEQIGVSKILIT